MVLKLWIVRTDEGFARVRKLRVGAMIRSAADKFCHGIQIAVAIRVGFAPQAAVRRASSSSDPKRSVASVDADNSAEWLHAVPAVPIRMRVR